MALRIAIVGPGRVGAALARGFAAGGCDVLGFVGRNGARTAAAVAALGRGRVLQLAELRQAHVVVFAVGDADLRAAVQAAAAAAPRACSLWLHTSGRHELAVFDGVPDIRRGSLHPVAPFPGDLANSALRGAPAVLAGEPKALRLLQRLALRLGMVPLVAATGDRALYHAACALAANGLTALWSLAAAAFARSGVVDAAQAQALTGALIARAADACRELGPGAALTGPVRRGDAATVALHLERLAGDDHGRRAYAALAAQALELARAAGLPAAVAARIAALLPPGR